MPGDCPAYQAPMSIALPCQVGVFQCATVYKRKALERCRVDVGDVFYAAIELRVPVLAFLKPKKRYSFSGRLIDSSLSVSDILRLELQTAIGLEAYPVKILNILPMGGGQVFFIEVLEV